MARDLEISLSIALNGIIETPDGSATMYEDRRPSPAAMARLTARLEDISTTTVAHHPRDVGKALERAFDAMPSQSKNPVNQARVYMEELSDLDAGAVILVLKRFVRGDIQRDSDFVPTIAEIRHAVMQITSGFERERRRIEKVVKFWAAADAGDKKLTVVKMKTTQPIDKEMHEVLR